MRKIVAVIGATLFAANLAYADKPVEGKKTTQDQLTDRHGSLVSLTKAEHEWDGVLKTDQGEFKFYTKDGALAQMIQSNKELPLRMLCSQKEDGCEVETIFVN